MLTLFFMPIIYYVNTMDVKRFSKFLSLFFLLLISPEVHAFSGLSIVDQNDNSQLLSELMKPGGLIIVYRAREAAEAGNEHLSITREFLDDEVTVVRLADLSRVPRLFRGLAARQLKKEFTGYPYYIDTSGEIVDFFEVKDGYYGFFLYDSSGEKKRIITEYNSERELIHQLRKFLSGTIIP